MLKLIREDVYVKKTIIYFLIVILFNLIIGCQTYKASSTTETSIEKITSLTQQDKYFIIHELESTWQLTNPTVQQSDLIGFKIELEDWYKSKNISYSKGEIIYNRKDTILAKVVNEIHIYTESVVQFDSNYVSIPIDSIQAVQLYKPQQPKRGLIVLGSVIVGVGLIVLIALYW